MLSVNLAVIFPKRLNFDEPKVKLKVNQIKHFSFLERLFKPNNFFACCLIKETEKMFKKSVSQPVFLQAFGDRISFLWGLIFILQSRKCRLFKLVAIDLYINCKSIPCGPLIIILPILPQPVWFFKNIVSAEQQ